MPRASDTLILCYHALSDRWSDPVAVSQRRFAGHMRLLGQLGYAGVTFTDAVLTRSSGRRVAITFDDAFTSVAALALPILRACGWPATVYAVSSCADSGGLATWPTLDSWLGTRYEDELRTMNWEQLRDLQAAGWEIGSHTATHPHLTQLSPDRVRLELQESRRAVEQQIDGPCRSIAYPYGDVDAGVVALAEEAGYEAGAALPAGLHEERPLEWPRVGVYEVDHTLRLLAKSLPVARRLRSRRR